MQFLNTKYQYLVKYSNILQIAVGVNFMKFCKVRAFDVWGILGDGVEKIKFPEYGQIGVFWPPNLEYEHEIPICTEICLPFRNQIWEKSENLR